MTRRAPDPIRRWKSVPSNLRPKPEEFRPFLSWRWGGGGLSQGAIEKMTGGTVGWLANEEVREVADYVYCFLTSAAALQYAAAAGDPRCEVTRRSFRSAMAPLIESARYTAERPTKERLSALLDYCRREGVNPF